MEARECAPTACVGSQEVKTGKRRRCSSTVESDLDLIPDLTSSADMHFFAS